MLVIGRDTWSLSFIELPRQLATLKNKWAGVVKTEDGRLYCAPWCVECVLAIDPRHLTLSLIPTSARDLIAEHGWCKRLHYDLAYDPCVPSECTYQWCGIAATEGRIWCAPDRANEVLTLMLPKENISSLLRSGSADFDLTVGGESGDEVQCHCSVIASASKVFHAMLASGFKEKQTHRIVVPGISAATAKHLVEHIYSGLLPRGSDVEQLAELAHQYHLDLLLAQCLEALLRSLSTNTEACVVQALRRHSEASFEAMSLWRGLEDIVRRDENLCPAVAEALSISKSQ